MLIPNALDFIYLFIDRQKYRVTLITKRERHPNVYREYIKRAQRPTLKDNAKDKKKKLPAPKARMLESKRREQISNKRRVQI